MNAIRERAVRMCFEGDILQSLVLNVLRIHKEHKPRETPRVTPLEVLSIQSIMAVKLKGDVEGLVIYSLVFGELVRYCIFGHMGDFRGRLKKEHDVPMGKDPELMLAVVEHNLDRFQLNRIYLNVQKEWMAVSLDNSHIGAAPHKHPLDFDTSYARTFARLAISKHIPRVKLKTWGPNGRHYEKNLMEMVRKLDCGVPQEGWKEAVEDGKRTIYKIASTTDEYRFCVNLHLANEYSPSDSYVHFSDDIWKDL